VQSTCVEIRTIEKTWPRICGPVFQGAAWPEFTVDPIPPATALLNDKRTTEWLNVHAAPGVPDLLSFAPNIVCAGTFGNHPSVRQTVENVADAGALVRMMQNALAIVLQRTSVV